MASIQYLPPPSFELLGVTKIKGPTNFVIDASDLKALIAGNFIPKYADDAYLIVPPNNAHTIDLELQGISTWASANNLALNITKSQHIVFRRPRFRREHESIVAVGAFKRVYEIKILGVTISYTLSLSSHVLYLAGKSDQILFTIRILRSHGLSGASLWEVSRAYIIGRLTYASPAWWGFCTIGERDQLEAVVGRMVRRHFLPPDQRPLHEIIDAADMRLFRKVSSNPHHVSRNAIADHSPIIFYDVIIN